MQKILKCFFVLVCVLLMFILSASATTLPNGYTQLEYIESTGTQYIDTGIKPNKNTEIELFTKSNVAGRNSNFFFGYEYQYTLVQASRDGCFAFDFNRLNVLGNRISSSVIASDYFHKIEIKNQIFYIDGNQIGDFISINDFSTSSNIYLFGSKNAYNGEVSITYCKIWQSGTLVRNFVPAKRKHDGVLGMYDLVNNKFYINSGTGTFIAGPAVCAATVAILGAQFCLTEIQPSGSYLNARYNNNKYYINLSVENDALNPKTITSESNNVLRIKVGNTTYNAHDTSVE